MLVIGRTTYVRSFKTKKYGVGLPKDEHVRVRSMFEKPMFESVP